MRWPLACCGVAVVAASLGWAACPPTATALGAATDVVATPAALRDFMTQDGCLDKAGTVMLGVSPIDDPACAAHRDLRPGERLPYHKHDHPSSADRGFAPTGYQRHDSFPVETAGLGTVVEQSFDFGAGEGRRFGMFDRGSDGGDIVILSPGAAAIGATEDGGGGFQLFVGDCRGAVDAAALTRSWIIAEFDPDRPAPLDGETIARLNDLKTGRQDACPSHFNSADTRWHVAPFRYRALPGQGKPVTLTTLISTHYGGANPATAFQVERFYFTRELGGTRWESWVNARGNQRFSAATVAARAAWFASTGRCSAAPPPAGGATMLLIDCREWTNIVPPVDPAGDLPGFFLAAVRARAGAPAFFAPPAAPKP
jgi:hypothetical protein